MASGKKQYGLQIPRKAAQPIIKSSVFGDDSDSDKSDGGDWMKKAAKTDFSSSIGKRQTKLEIEKALKEDATVFQYDEIYDDMEQKKQSSTTKEKDRKPKYVEKLLAVAEKRKIENERRYERLVQKEREAEGDEFKDKETFITSAYKKKLEEFAKLDEEQRRQDMLEEIGDVTKQQDISGFYRHLYQSTVAEKESGDGTEKDKKDGEVEVKKTATRQYRKRKDSNSSVAEKNKDADSNFGSSSTSDESSEESEASGGNSSHSDTEDPKRIRLKKYNDVSEEKPQSPPKPVEKEEPKMKDKKANDKKKEEPKEPPIDIWKKRTVGPVFDAAVERYLSRKAARVGAAA